MNQTPDPRLPLKNRLGPLHAGSLLVALLMAGASAAGLLAPASVYPAEDLRRTFMANDAVNLLLGLPLLLGVMGLARRGRLVGLLCWPGALMFVLYNYIAYLFAAPLTWAFPVYLVLVAASAYTLIGLAASLDPAAVQHRLAGKVPERLGGGVLAGLGLLFLLRVIGVVSMALTAGTPLAETELAVNVADFLTSPALILGGILLWRRKAFGYAAGLGLLFQTGMLFLALILVLLLQSILTKAPLALTDIVVVFLMGLVSFVPFILFLRGVVRSEG